MDKQQEKTGDLSAHTYMVEGPSHLDGIRRTLSAYAPVVISDLQEIREILSSGLKTISEADNSISPETEETTTVLSIQNKIDKALRSITERNLNECASYAEKGISPGMPRSRVLIDDSPAPGCEEIWRQWM